MRASLIVNLRIEHSRSLFKKKKSMGRQEGGAMECYLVGDTHTPGGGHLFLGCSGEGGWGDTPS